MCKKFVIKQGTEPSILMDFLGSYISTVAVEPYFFSQNMCCFENHLEIYIERDHCN